MSRPVLGITMGDAAGIGPEIILKAFQGDRLFSLCSPLIIGSLPTMEFYKSLLGVDISFRPINHVSQASAESGTLDILDLGLIDTDALKIGKTDPAPGKAAVIFTQKAAQLAAAGRIDAVVSAPLNKEAMRLAGYSYEGQTQIFAEITGSKRYGMILLLGSIRAMMLTTHLPLREACDAVTKENILEKIELAHESLVAFGIERPKIAVAGLNPHAGEGGLFGREEVDETIPAIEAALMRGIDVVGPMPADVVFLKARDGEFDLTLAMYHDQANMVAKFLGFGKVVTLLAGMPIIRTSVGHGTAFDIAGKGVADEANFIKAIEVAAELAVTRKRSGDEHP